MSDAKKKGPSFEYMEKCIDFSNRLLHIPDNYSRNSADIVRFLEGGESAEKDNDEDDVRDGERHSIGLSAVISAKESGVLDIEMSDFYSAYLYFIIDKYAEKELHKGAIFVYLQLTEGYRGKTITERFQLYGRKRELSQVNRQEDKEEKDYEAKANSRSGIKSAVRYYKDWLEKAAANIFGAYYANGSLNYCQEVLERMGELLENLYKTVGDDSIKSSNYGSSGMASYSYYGNTLVSRVEKYKKNGQRYIELLNRSVNSGRLDLSTICNWHGIGSTVRNLLRDSLPDVHDIAALRNVFQFIPHAMSNLGLDTIAKNHRIYIMIGMLSAVLRSYWMEKSEFDSSIEIKVQAILFEEGSPVEASTLIKLAGAAGLNRLAELSDQVFSLSRNDVARTALAFSVFTIYLTDIYLILTAHAERYADMIRYKTNAEVCGNLEDLHKYVTFNKEVPFRMDIARRRLNVCLNCYEANSHKAAVLFVNEFDRHLLAFEDIFSAIGLELYYIRASVDRYGSDNVNNYNFEAYTPTLIPLLSGGHLYGSRQVFLRELVQNAIDSISVRKYKEGLEDSDSDFDKIIVNIKTQDDLDIESLEIIDTGTGMGEREIERYLTSIGRSFYTAGDFRKMNLGYKPISSFGIGFLSCFLVCSRVIIHTHSIDEGKSYELMIPNIEGCFFIEEPFDDFPVGTKVILEMDARPDSPKISLYSLLEYADNHFLDVPLDITFSWNEPALTLMDLATSDGKPIAPINTDIAKLARQDTHTPPSDFAFACGGLIFNDSSKHQFVHDWWNKYMKKQLDGAGLRDSASPNLGNRSFTIPRHVARKVEGMFFIFIPFIGEGDVPCACTDNLEDTYQYPYGIFITDLPGAGMKMRSISNGIRPYSGILRILNAGILIDEGSLERVFGKEMRIHTNDMETAHNNVLINFPPNWINLNISREKLISLSLSAQNKDKLLKGIAMNAVKGIEAIQNKDISVPLVNIHEIVNFISVVCTDFTSVATI